MADFSVGANCFLNSPYATRIWGPNPVTERGFGFHINAHPKLPLLIYPNGKFVIIKNINDPNSTFVYRGHSYNVTVAKFSPTGNWVASADIGGNIRIWAWDNPEHLTKLDSPGFSSKVLDIDWDMESKRIVAVGEGSDVMAKVFMWDTGNTVGEIIGHSKKILSVTYKPSRPFRIMTCGEDFRSIFHSGPPFKVEKVNECHTNYAACVRYSPDGKHLASVGSDKKIQFYDATTGVPKSDIVNAHAASIFSISFSPDSNKFATASGDKTVKIWDANTLALHNTINVSDDPQINDAQVSVLWNSTVSLVSVSLNGNINILNESSLAPVRIIQAHQSSLSALCIDPASMVVYTGSIDGVILQRNFESGDSFRLLGNDKKSVVAAVHGNKVVGLEVINGQLISVGWDDKVRFCNTTDRCFYGELQLSGQPCCLARSSQSDLYLIVTNTDLLLLKGQSIVGSFPVSSLSYSPTVGAIYAESEIAIGGSDYKTHIYSIVNNTFIESGVISTRSEVSALAYGPTGDLLAIGDAGRQLEVHERTAPNQWTPKVQGRWVFHTSKITTVAWSSDGKYIASGGLDENIFVWNYFNINSKIDIPYAHKGGVSAVKWLDSSYQMVSTGNDGITVTWKLPLEN